MCMCMLPLFSHGDFVEYQAFTPPFQWAIPCTALKSSLLFKTNKQTSRFALHFPNFILFFSSFHYCFVKRRMKRKKKRRRRRREKDESDYPVCFSPDLRLMRIFQMHYDVWMVEVVLGAEPLAPQLKSRIFCFFL